MTAGKRLLVVDDEPGFAKLVARVAGDLGYDAVYTTSAEAFQEAYLAVPPAVVVLDIVMPGLDGIEMIRWLADRGCRAPIVIISGYNPAYSDAARKLGELSGRLHISQLQKPVKLAELRAHLSQWVAGPQPS